MNRMKHSAGIFLILLITVAAGCKDIHNQPIIENEFYRSGLEGIRVNNLHLIGENIYASTENGVFMIPLEQHEDSWEMIGLDNLNVVGLVPLAGDTLLAGVDTGELQSETHTLYRSLENQNIWEPYQQNYGGDDSFNIVKAMAADFHHPGRIYARGAFHVARSDDYGDSWNTVFGDWGSAGYQASLLKTDPHHPGKIWAGGENSVFQPYLAISDEDGITWESQQVHQEGDDAVYSLVFHPEDEERVLIGMEGKILESRDSGSSWQTLFSDEDYPYILAMTQANGQLSSTVFASGTEKGTAGGNIFFYHSEDFGQSWDKISAVPPHDGQAVQDLLVFRVGGVTVVYLATTDGIWVYRWES